MKIRKKQKILPGDVPIGTFIHTESGYFYVYSSTRRLRITTQRVLQSWTPARVFDLSEKDKSVQKLKISGKMKFRNGSLLYSQADGRMFVVADNKLRHITNPDWLEFYGRSPVWVSKAEINLHEMGEELE